ncbi:MAG: PAS domain-containing protein [Nitrospirae bacterium]|nr:PAS domain-containing protein [Nitrospirota bacterium]
MTVKVFLGLGILFCLLLYVEARRDLAETQRVLESTSFKELEATGHRLARELEGRAPEGLDAFTIYQMMQRVGGVRITLSDRQGRILVDTEAQIKPGDPWTLRGIEARDLDRVWEGDPALSLPYPAEGNMRQAAFFPVRDHSGEAWAVGRLEMDRTKVLASVDRGAPSPALWVFGGSILGLLAYTVVRRWIVAARAGSAAGAPGAEERVGIMLGAFQDVVGQLKEKERTAEERAASAESYQIQILRSIPSGVMSFDLEGRVALVNGAAERILHRTRETLLGKPCGEVFGEANGWVTQIVEETIASGHGVDRREETIRLPDSRTIWVGLSAAPLRDAAETPLGAILTFADLTEVHRLRRENALRERLALLGEMSAGIAHELRNPMGVLTGYSALLLKQTPPEDPRRDTLERLREETEGMNRIVTQFLLYARPAVLQRERVDLNALLEEIRSSPLSDRSGIQTEFQIEGSLPPIEGDSVLLRQALSNLAQNAVESMPEGGVLLISAEVQSPKSNVQSHLGDLGPWTSDLGRFIEISVSDTGVGIPPEHLDRIFDPFFTLKAGGTGLGLALAQKFILAHGGRIEVESEVGIGSTFRVILPVGGKVNR